jgi:hypothetical protein
VIRLAYAAALGFVSPAFGCAGELDGAPGDDLAATTSTTTGDPLPPDEPSAYEDDGASGCAYVCPDDPPADGTAPCDLTAPACWSGTKCVPLPDADAGSNEGRCATVWPTPARAGEPCAVDESGGEFFDTCDAASMCWALDPATGIGTCFAFCAGSLDDTCDDLRSRCVTVSVAALCPPTCDPVAADCAAPMGCFPIEDAFLCYPVIPDTHRGPGEGCRYHNECAPGLFCLGAPTMPGDRDEGLCTAYCDVTDEAAAETCPGFANGERCLPWYDDSPPPADLDHVGWCGIP